VRPVGLGDNNYNNINNVNANNQFNNNGRSCGIALGGFRIFMITFNKLFEKLVSIENLQDAYWKSRKHKSNSPAVIKFEKHWQLHLTKLHKELKTRTYKPKPLKSFILRDPKTRTICVSEFKDRIVHHALVNTLQPIFEPRFIYDSYASRKNKGTLPALKRFYIFLRKVTKNGKQIPNFRNSNDIRRFALKADIKHYFETVDHKILLNIISKRIKDDGVLWLTKLILNNHKTKIRGKGIPLGNWTSQFLANVYLNELDQYIKHELKAKYYLRYVDDFVILNQSKNVLIKYKKQIKSFLHTLKLELHPDKCKVIPLKRGISFLGFKCFYHYKLIRRRNIRKIHNKLKEKIKLYKSGKIEKETIQEILQGWNAYAKQGNSYKLRKKLIAKIKQEMVN